MQKSHWVRLLAGAALVASSVSFAANYKCKDANGKWSEQACPDYKQRKAEERAAAEREAASTREPTIGMSKAEVLALKWEFERPKHIMTTNEAGHSHEQWEATCQYLYFDDGILTATQWTCSR